MYYFVFVENNISVFSEKTSRVEYLIRYVSQNSDDTMVQVDGFVFDGPVASGQSNGEQRTTSTTTTSTTTTVSSTTLSNNQYNECLNNCPVIIILLLKLT